MKRYGSKVKRYRQNATVKPTAYALAVILTFLGVLAYEFLFKDMFTSSLPEGVMYAQFIDVGQGDSTLLTSPTGEHVLIDTGPRSSEGALIRHLNDAGVETIDYLILTHPHEDHIGGAAAVLEKFTVEAVIMPDAYTETSVFTDLLEAIEAEGCDTILAESGNTYTFGECSLTVLGPLDTEGKDLNNVSVVCRVDYGKSSILFTGDMEKSYESELVERHGFALDCDVLKVGHHGSDTSTGEEFIEKVTPKLAVISCAEANEYGHPHSEVVNRLNKYNIEYYRTDKLGTVIIASDGKDEWYYED